MPGSENDGDLKDVRCPTCRALVFKMTEDSSGRIEIVCRKCRRRNVLHLHGEAKRSMIPSIGTSSAYNKRR